MPQLLQIPMHGIPSKIKPRLDHAQDWNYPGSLIPGMNFMRCSKIIKNSQDSKSPVITAGKKHCTKGHFFFRIFALQQRWITKCWCCRGCLARPLRLDSDIRLGRRSYFEWAAQAPQRGAGPAPDRGATSHFVTI